MAETAVRFAVVGPAGPLTLEGVLTTPGGAQPVAGVVVAQLVENGRPVEYGEALFSIRPL